MQYSKYRRGFRFFGVFLVLSGALRPKEKPFLPQYKITLIYLHNNIRIIYKTICLILFWMMRMERIKMEYCIFIMVHILYFILRIIMQLTRKLLNTYLKYVYALSFNIISNTAVVYIYICTSFTKWNYYNNNIVCRSVLPKKVTLLVSGHNMNRKQP